MRAKAVSSQERERSLRYSILDGATDSVMVGIGEGYLTPFALALGAGNLVIGLLSAVPSLLGALVKPLGAWLAARIGQRKPVLVWSALGESLTWLLLPLLAFFALPREAALVGLLALVSLYRVFSSIILPPWASLIGDLVPSQRRGRYFGARNQIAGFVGLGAVAAGAWVLGLFPRTTLAGFAVLFGLAAFARALGAYYLSRHTEPVWKPNHPPTVNALAFARKTRRTDFGRFTTYASLLVFAVNVASPFFAVYMLRDLHFDYFTFGLLLALSTLAQVMAMPYWGRLADLYGNRAVLAVGGALVPLVPILWLVNGSPVWIALVQAFAGFAWAAFDLAAFDYLMDTTHRQNRAEYFAHYAVFNGLAVFLGAGVGGLLSQAWNNASLFGLEGLQLVILASAVLRAAASAWRLPSVSEVRTKREVPRHFLFEAAALQPMRSVLGQMLHAPEALLSVERRVVEGARRAVSRSSRVGR